MVVGTPRSYLALRASAKVKAVMVKAVGMSSMADKLAKRIYLLLLVPYIQCKVADQIKAHRDTSGSERSNGQRKIYWF